MAPRKRKAPEPEYERPKGPLLRRRVDDGEAAATIPEGIAKLTFPRHFDPDSLAVLKRWLENVVVQWERIASVGAPVCAECAAKATVFEVGDDRAWCEEHIPESGWGLHD